MRDVQLQSRKKTLNGKKSEEDVLRERIKELEKRNEFLEKAMMNLLENVGE